MLSTFNLARSCVGAASLAEFGHRRDPFPAQREAKRKGNHHAARVDHHVMH